MPTCDMAIDEVLALIREYTQDIDNIQQKEYLNVAMTSHITRASGYPQEFVNRVVNLFFLTGSL